MNLRRLASTAVVATVAVALAPSAAQARTLIGSGSSVAEPYLRALFAGYHHVRPRVKFVYTADGGNAGVKDVQQGRASFAVNTRPPLPCDSGTTYRQLFLDGLCIDVNSANHLTNINVGPLADLFLGTVTNWGQVPGSGLRRRSPRSAATRPRGPTRSSRARCSTARRSRRTSTR